tara:strand:- start:564 stop:788 length:225 start_codon:yes stop_codon:yes gene_type:complete
MVMENNTNNSYKGFVRSTSNILTTTNQYQVSLPPHIWKKMKWKLNEDIRIVINKDTNTLELRKEISDDKKKAEN